jgi:tetratricopeptide (TPR) repeat protein
MHTAGVTAYNKGQNLDRATQKIGLAVNLDASRDSYWRTFAQLLSLRAQEVLNTKDLTASELQQRYQVALQGMIRAGQRSIDANPLDPLNWRQLGAIYEDNIAVVGGADGFAVQNYEKAVSQNPQNPAEYMNIARAYVRAADALQAQVARLSQGKDAAANKEEIAKVKAEREDRLAKSLEALGKSISRKADYAPAHFLSSQVYERQGNRALAIEKSVEARDLNPFDTGVGYQLGLLYYLDNQTGKAREELERIVRLSENFSNARYFLGLSYDKLGNTQAAIEQFEKVAELNPENSEVRKILENLRAGKEALANVVPPPQSRIETPVEETGGEEETEL